MKNENYYYLGLDIGTDSVGYAVADEEYNLLKFRGEPMWGVHLFDEAMLGEERRSFRVARRRLDRRQQRVRLLRGIFALEIAKLDPHFYRRIKESALWREDASDRYCLFADDGFTDVEYHKQYPTIHHLICELIDNPSPHDVRLVYLACAWLVAHRGHFLSDVSKDNVEELLNIKTSYDGFMEFFGDIKPWTVEPQSFGDVLKKQIGITAKYRELCRLLFDAPKAPKDSNGEYPYSIEHTLKLLCGGKASPKDLFSKEEYAELSSFTLNGSEDELAELLGAIGDDADFVLALKSLYDWSVLADILSGAEYISKNKVEIFSQHKKDLRILKQIVRKYVPEKYKAVFRDESVAGYASYSKSGKQEEFCKYIRTILKSVSPDDNDAACFEDLMQRAEAGILCPKQVTGDNRVVPYQVYWVELRRILENASGYLSFLSERDEDGYVTKDKILSIMEFRVPYYVGPLNSDSKRHWFVRREGKTGRILPWDFEQMVDLDLSEQAFIDKMTNTCTYLPDADVLPKCSLLHERFQVLNEINSLSVNGERITVALKKRIFNELFCTRKKVTLKAIRDFLKREGLYTEDELKTLEGADETIKSSLASYHIFKNLISSKQLSEDDVEEIIKRSTYTEERSRFTSWVWAKFPHLSEDDKRHISRQKFKDFARLSGKLLCEIYGTENGSETGEAMSIIERMWNENLNLMEILSDRFTYKEVIEKLNDEYFSTHTLSLDERLKSMWISNSVKRAIIRTLDIVGDVVKINGAPPKKIFVEMARGSKEDERGKRTKSRYEQLRELYASCELEEAREMEASLESLGEDRDRKLQGEKLFLYYLQLGRSMYSFTPIDIERLGEKLYDIDHIYPQSKVKDDSLWNNKVLVLSEENGEKGDRYPISEDIRKKMYGWWKQLLDRGFITPEKFKRLTRHTPFDENEEWGFINRQLVETRQSTKAVATILREMFPDSEIVYVKAGRVSDFRRDFDMLKSRAVNDLHHAKDAYLNIVVGNVYNERFTHEWFVANRERYNLKIKTLFSREVVVKGRRIWNGGESVGRVKQIIHRNNAIHLTRYSYCRHGGLFNQQPLSAAEGLVPRKANLPTEKYGGYNSKTATYFMLVAFTQKNKREVMFVPVDLMYADRMKNEESAKEYICEQIKEITGKPISDPNFPLGLRPIKINTLLVCDGLYMTLASKSTGGKKVGVSIMTPLIVGYRFEKYIKRLESFAEKKKQSPGIKHSQFFDQISFAENEELYIVLMEKLKATIFSKRPASPIDVIASGFEKFKKLDMNTQVDVLLRMVALFGRTTNGCDLTALGGKPLSGVPTMSSSLSNWTKKYQDVRIVDRSASGLYESRSENLLELL